MARLFPVSLPPFETVVRDHGTAVYQVCRAVLGAEAAEDAWSETFLSALGAYPRLRAGSDVRAWLVTIAHRKAIDGYRAGRRSPVPLGQVPDSGSEDRPSEPDAELGRAVRRLPPKQRAAVAYRYLGDLSYADIATLLDCSEAAARRSAADGIATLRRTYAPREVTS